MMDQYFNHVEGERQIAETVGFDWLQYTSNNKNEQVPEEAQQEVKKAHHQIYGSKRWIRPLPVAANVASQNEGTQNLLVPESQNKHTQKLARCMHTLKKCLFAQRYEKQIKIEASLQIKAIVASNTHAANYHGR